MTPHYDDGSTAVYLADCLAVLRALPDSSVDAIVTDPPYGLSNTDPSHVAETVTRWVGGDREYLPATGGGFMGKAWDSFVPPVAVWDEALRVLKPPSSTGRRRRRGPPRRRVVQRSQERPVRELPTAHVTASTASRNFTAMLSAARRDSSTSPRHRRASGPSSTASPIRP